MNIQDLKDQFPDGAEPPKLLARLVEWRNDWSRRSGHADLRDYLGLDFNVDRSRLIDWLGEEGAAAVESELAVFAHDWEGSLLGLWLYEGRSSEEAPVVVLHAEGIPNSSVVANSLPEFLQMLLPTEQEARVLSSSGGERGQALMSLREWLQHDCGIAPLKTSKESDAIEERARQSHPSFEEWLGGF